MMNPRECANVWETVCNCYDETIKTANPEIAMDKIIEKVGMRRAKEVFATFAKIKKNDGRISGYNRKKLENIAVNEKCLERSESNPMINAGLDHIHTAHVDNLISQLLKRCRIYEEIDTLSMDNVYLDGVLLCEDNITKKCGHIVVSSELLEKLERNAGVPFSQNTHLLFTVDEYGKVEVSIYIKSSTKNPAVKYVTYAPINMYIESEFADLLTDKVQSIYDFACVLSQVKDMSNIEKKFSETINDCHYNEDKSDIVKYLSNLNASESRVANDIIKLLCGNDIKEIVEVIRLRDIVNYQWKCL